ncbi:MAG: hypothetical protein J0L81_07610 [Caulobacterales bacterium]|jgi:hypothetical protein|nr:hypothetical protein [Caulobacterales bacterium]
MDRMRFETLLEAYGADFSRWPAEERGAAESFAARNAEVGEALAEARALDAALEAARAVSDTSALAARILACAPSGAAPVGFDRRALMALAACALFGVVLGFGGGLLAPLPPMEDDEYFAMAFEAPMIGEEG